MSRQSRIGYELLRCLSTIVGKTTRDDVSLSMPIGESSYRVSRIERPVEAVVRRRRYGSVWTRPETTERELKTAVVLVLSQFSPELAALHAEYYPAAVARGIPLHITLLAPFVPRRALTDSVIATLRTFFAERAPLSFELARIDAFPDALYAAPEPAAELIDLIDELAPVFPETPPYGGAFAQPIPHATLAVPAEGGEGEHTAEKLRGAAASLLPVPCEVTYASLLEEHEHERWSERERFRLAGD